MTNLLCFSLGVGPLHGSFHLSWDLDQNQPRAYWTLYRKNKMLFAGVRRLSLFVYWKRIEPLKPKHLGD